MYDNFMGDNSEWRKLRNKLRAAGYRVEGGGNRNYKVYRDDKLISTMPSSPGGGRGLRNQIARLRREGIAI